MAQNKRNVQKCECCGSTIAERKITLYNGMIKSLIKAYNYAVKNETDRFKRRDIKHMMKSESESARFGDWVLFGGLLHKEGKGNYVIHKERCREFFRGELKIPTAVWKDTVTGKVVEKVDEKTINEIEGLEQLLDEEGRYIPEYRERSTKQNKLI